jgi:hypothetical protein
MIAKSKFDSSCFRPLTFGLTAGSKLGVSHSSQDVHEHAWLESWLYLPYVYTVVSQLHAEVHRVHFGPSSALCFIFNLSMLALGQLTLFALSPF